MSSKDRILDKAKSAKRESRYIEFKGKFDPDRPSDWCEIVKDVVAMANSGGGCILLGVEDNGKPSGWDVTPVLKLDAARITDQIAKYTGEQFADLDIEEIERDGRTVAALCVYAASVPLVFSKPDTYDIGAGRQKIAFRKGTVYFRHGAKSEPGSTRDLSRCIEREVKRLRESWLGNIKKVISAPVGYEMRLVPGDTMATGIPAGVPIRVVDDETASAYKRVYADDTHPHRQKEVIQLVNQRLKGGKTINSHDILSVRRVYDIDESEPDYFYRPKFGSPQYSETSVDWLVSEYDADPSFFEKARRGYGLQRRATSQR